MCSDLASLYGAQASFQSVNPMGLTRIALAGHDDPHERPCMECRQTRLLEDLVNQFCERVYGNSLSMHQSSFLPHPGLSSLAYFLYTRGESR